MRTIAAIWLGAGVLAAAVMAVPAGAQSVAPSATDKVVITGRALNMSNTATGATQSIRITIDKWSSAAQRQQLIETFLAKKQDGLLRELESCRRSAGSTSPAIWGPTRTTPCGSARTSDTP